MYVGMGGSAADITIHLIVLAIFILLPTTNIRPAITGNSLSERMLALVYQLQDTYIDSQIEALKTEEQKYLDNKDTIANLETMYTAINLMLPSKELKMRVVIEDLNGTLLAERTITSEDFK